MATLPVSWVISIIALLACVAMLSQPRLPDGARLYFLLALVSTALASGFAGVRLQYGLGVWVDLQPHVAALLAPTFWLGFRSFMEQEGWPKRHLVVLHGSLAIVAQAGIALPLPWSADIVVTLVTAIYMTLTASLLRHAQDRFVQVKPEGFRKFRAALVGCTVFLTLILISDSAIILAAFFTGNAGAMRFLAGTSTLFVTAILMTTIIALPLLFKRRATAEARGSNLNLPQDEDHEIIARIESVMAKTQIYRDPNLTLARLGRRLHCPARAVSNAVNRCTGENVSRYINAFRVRHAATLLESGDLSVTEVMLEAGFQSKSTFNTEFRRVLGTTPTVYRKRTTQSE